MSKKNGFVIGQRVRAGFPNGYWGPGVVVEVKPSGATVRDPISGRQVPAKPIVVRRDRDGHLGYFHYDQIVRLT